MSIRGAVKTWLDDGRAQGWSDHTLTNRQQNIERFCWWVEHRRQATADLDVLEPEVIRAFLTYLREPDPAGRWGEPHPSSVREVRPSTVHTYFKALRAFCNFCREEGLLHGNPLRNVSPGKLPDDDVVPFTAEQLQRVLDGARQGPTPDRDVAIIYVLVDSGLRVAELCSLTMGMVQRGSAQIRVLGKGNKWRTVYIGQKTRRLLWRYLEQERRDAGDEEPVFISVGGHNSGGALTESGVYQIIHDAGERASVQGVRCSPHTCRHTFAINFLRGGGDIFELQRLLGHESLEMVRRYVKYAEADLADAHRRASPGDRMKLR